MASGPSGTVALPESAAPESFGSDQSEVIRDNYESPLRIASRFPCPGNAGHRLWYGLRRSDNIAEIEQSLSWVSPAS